MEAKFNPKIVIKAHQDKKEYQEWDLIPRIALCRLKGEGTAVAFGWLIWGIVIAAKLFDFNET